ncbi:MAG: tetraacyldisaccharide 4'-kinase [Maribacter sp.]|nr:tetraacyldisaccharide 4'-kinase [Maribacter sp.]
MLLLRKIAFPISMVYALVVYLRNFLFDVGIFKEISFKTKTICIGNLSVGGTGKTPMIEYLIEMLGNSYKVAVLSRGYRRKSKGFILATPKSTVEKLGDEPYQIYSKYPEIVLAVDGDRCNGISNLENTLNLDVILLDDAFQHRKVRPHYSILLTAYDDLYINDWYLPTGNLRDAKKEAKRANIIVVTKCPNDLSENGQIKIKQLLKPRSHQKVLFGYLSYEKKLKGGSATILLGDLLAKKITLVTGIAKPKPLVDYLRNEGIELEHLEFKDHHFFTSTEIEAFNTKECILTTEKDYVRLQGRVNNLYYISIRHKLLNDGKVVLENEMAKLMR